MTDNYTDNPNAIRFSFVSCMTEDSIDSNGLATPLDASPPPPPSNTFSIINIVNDDPLPNTRSFPGIASTYTAQRRAQTSSPRPTAVHTNLEHNNNNSNSQVSTVPNSSKFTRFWPKFKQSILFTNSTTQAVDNETEPFNKNQENKSRHWFGKNRARVGIQR